MSTRGPLPPNTWGVLHRIQIHRVSSDGMSDLLRRATHRVLLHPVPADRLRSPNVKHDIYYAPDETKRKFGVNGQVYLGFPVEYTPAHRTCLGWSHTPCISREHILHPG